MNIGILFENKNLIVINKPSGLVVHADGKTNEPTVVDWVLENYPEINGVGENMIVKDRDGNEVELNRPGIVHRIDRDTSGCLLIAKTQESFEHLKGLFKDRAVSKTYNAIVHGTIKDDEGIIDAGIGRSSKDFRMKQAGSHARGQLRDALTEYSVIERYEDESNFDKQKQTIKYTLVECRPKTGRTHQIRVHMKHINHPIVSDSLYAGKRKPALGIERTALHAKKLEFIDSNGDLLLITASTPEDITNGLMKVTKL